ncbi:MAG: permease-like cell division protein FtsX [Candidatus Paceibacterota bacterium]|jgi:cell division transport system permease protein
MFWTKIKRVLRWSFASFWRNGFVSLAAVAVMTVTLFVIGSLVFTGVLLRTSLDALKDKVDVNVYFITSAPEEEILSLKKSLETLSEVAKVEYVSREQALEDFKNRHQDDQLTLQSLDELGENPLGAALNIKATDAANYEGIAKFLDQGGRLIGDGKTPIIDKVNYYQNKIAIDKLIKVTSSAQTLGLFVILFFAAVSILITYNTIRLTIFISRDEVSVMRLMGASGYYISARFLLQAALYGIASTAITLLAFYPVTYWLGPKTVDFFFGVNVFRYYLDNFPQIFLLILGSGIVLGVASSFLAVRRYLNA